MRTEIVAGLTTFFAMACIRVVNPQVLAAPFVLRGDMEYVSQIANGVFFVTCPIAFPGTFLMAVYVKVPFAQAPGMGQNAFFAYTVIPGKNIPVRERWRLFLAFCSFSLRQSGSERPVSGGYPSRSSR